MAVFGTHEKGQSLVEFALLLPVMLLMLLGLIQFAMVFSGYISVSNAAKEGVRQAIVGTNDEDVRTMVKGELLPFVNVQDNIGIEQENGYITVEFDAAVDALPIIGSFFSRDTFTLHGHAKMRYENPGQDAV